MMGSALSGNALYGSDNNLNINAEQVNNQKNIMIFEPGPLVSGDNGATYY